MALKGVGLVIVQGIQTNMSIELQMGLKSCDVVNVMSFQDEQ